MGIQFVELELDGIEEGTFISEVNDELKKLQESIMRHVKIYGEKSKGSKAELAVKISLAVEDPDSKAFSIKTTVTTKLPARPSGLSLATGHVAEGQARLWMPPSGIPMKMTRRSANFPPAMVARLIKRQVRLRHEHRNRRIDRG